MVIFISSHNPTFVAIFNDKGRKLYLLAELI